MVSTGRARIHLHFEMYDMQLWEARGRRLRAGDLLIHDPRYWKSIEYRSSWYQFVVKTCLRRRMKGYAASGIQS